MSLKPVYFDEDQANAIIAAGLGGATPADPNCVQASAIGGGLVSGIVGTLLMDQLKKFLESGQLQAVLQQVVQKLIEQLLASFKTPPKP